MSVREQIQNQIEEYLTNNSYFDAPYGVIPGITSIGKGKIRTVTFGVSRYLDANVEIWTKNKIVVKGQGGLSYKFEGKFNSIEELINHFNKETRKTSCEVTRTV